ncbi:MAG TPA: cytochrome c [Rhodanobacteraceae bacterium]|nr:cytochrome c [Rhodanobacteraceae bacterium]
MNARLLIGGALASLALGMPASFAADASDPIVPSDALKHAGGEEIYRRVCQGCHMPDGRGAQGGGTYPALAENPHLASAQFTAVTVALGRRNMPHFAPQPELGAFEAFVVMHLDDAEIAAVVNYVRSHFGNHYTDELTAADIAKLHP